MKEIQDTVKALKKQLEDIDTKDKVEDKETANKKEEEEEEEQENTHNALLINEARNDVYRIQLQKQENENKNTTSNEPSTNPSTSQTKFDRFVT